VRGEVLVETEIIQKQQIPVKLSKGRDKSNLYSIKQRVNGGIRYKAVVEGDSKANHLAI
jgi:hypothetical protein